MLVKLEWLGYRINCDDMLSHIHLIPERNGQTDRQTDGWTDRFAISISRVSTLTRDKNATGQQQKRENVFIRWSFCRAMLCISAAYAVVRCLSICLSVYLSRSSTETSKRILKLFHHLIDRPTILVFPYLNIMAIFRREASYNGSVECRFQGRAIIWRRISQNNTR